MSKNSNLENALVVLSQAVPPLLIDSIHAAREARDAVRAARADDDMIVMHEQLVTNRAQIERLEYLTSSLGFMRTRTDQNVARAKAAYDDAYMESATKKTVGFADYASAKEKDAHFALGTIEQTMDLRKAESSHRDVVAAWDYCRLMLRGAEGVQRDMEMRIRLISLRSQLER